MPVRFPSYRPWSQKQGRYGQIVHLAVTLTYQRTWRICLYLCHPLPAHQRVMSICCAAQPVNIRELQTWSADDGGVKVLKSPDSELPPPNIGDFTGIREKMTDFTHQFWWILQIALSCWETISKRKSHWEFFLSCAVMRTIFETLCFAVTRLFSSAINSPGCKKRKISVQFFWPWAADAMPLWCCSVWASLPPQSLWREEGLVWAIATSLGSSTMIILVSAGFSPRAVVISPE